MYLGIDIGTSSVKALLAGPDLAPVASVSVPLTIQHPAPGHSEQDPAAWWAAVISAVRKVLTGQSPTIQAIGLSGQMHGAVLLDADKTVLRPAILWNDSRAAEDSTQGLDEAPLPQIAGVRPAPGFTAPKLLWLKRHEPRTYACIAHILLPKDYVGLHLHGALATDTSDAAGTYLLDQQSRTWSPDLCAASATDPDWLPPILNGTDIAGYLAPGAAETLGLPPGIPISAGAGDTPAGAIALGAVTEGTGFISLGTSGQMFAASAAFTTAPETGVHSFAHCLPGTWYHMAAMLNGARPLSWFSEVTGTPVADLLTEAASSLDTGVPLFLPYLTGERTPHGDPLIRGSFYGLENGTTRAQMTRAITEAIAYSFADARDAIASVTQVPAALPAIGGGAQSTLVLQTIADATGLTLLQLDDAATGAALGAARLAAVACGDHPASLLAQRPDATAEITPDPGTEGRHAARLESYRALYAALAPMRSAPR